MMTYPNSDATDPLVGFNGLKVDWAVHNKGLTAVFDIDEMGRETVTICVMGDPLTEVAHPVDAGIKERFADAYASWKDGTSGNRENDLSGWPAINNKQVAVLNGLHIFTIDDLADVSDGNVSRIPYGRELRDKASKYLGLKKAEGKVSETEALRAQIAELKALVSDQLAARKSDEAKPTQALLEAALAAAKLIQPKRQPKRAQRKPLSQATRAKISASMKASRKRQAEAASAISQGQTAPDAAPVLQEI